MSCCSQWSSSSNYFSKAFSPNLPIFPWLVGSCYCTEQISTPFNPARGRDLLSAGLGKVQKGTGAAAEPGVILPRVLKPGSWFGEPRWEQMQGPCPCKATRGTLSSWVNLLMSQGEIGMGTLHYPSLCKFLRRPQPPREVCLGHRAVPSLQLGAAGLVWVWGCSSHAAAAVDFPSSFLVTYCCDIGSGPV